MVWRPWPNLLQFAMWIVLLIGWVAQEVLAIVIRKQREELGQTCVGLAAASAVASVP